ncbi:MAG: glycosyltransferase family 2 protein [Heyndrickxia sp.]
MARVRVFLFTYNRHNLLPRALDSLINQTFKNWVCELHNDYPDDLFPKELASNYRDSRIKVINHKSNLGGTASFNLAFEKTNIEYVSILEDDNWWEPNFLEEMLKVMDKHPSISMAWSNMKCWKENTDGSWSETGSNTGDKVSSDLVFYNKLEIKQLHGAIHSNGAMLLRTNFSEKYIIPNSTWFDVIESIRERTFDYPIVFVNKILANFSLTLNTHRTKDLSKWNAWQIMLCGSFLNFKSLNKADIDTFWNSDKATRLKNSHHYFIAALFYPKVRQVIKYAPLKNWIFFLAYYIKHPFLLLKTISNIRRNTVLKNFIDIKTQEQLQSI